MSIGLTFDEFANMKLRPQVPADSRPQAELFQQLLETELHWRWRTGEQPDLQESRDRFCHSADQVETAFQQAAATSSDNMEDPVISLPEDDSSASPALTQTQTHQIFPN